MNINDFKQHLHAVHNTLDDPSLNKQMKDRLKESPVCDMKEYKPNVMKDKSTHKPTTGAGDTLRPNSKTAERMEKLKETNIQEISGFIPAGAEEFWGGKKKAAELNKRYKNIPKGKTKEERGKGFVPGSGFIPNHPDVDEFYGGKPKADKLRRALNQPVDGKNIPKVKVKVGVEKKRVEKKKKRKNGKQSEKQSELFAANQYFENYFGDNLTEDTSDEDIMEAVDALVELCADVCEAVGLEEKIIIKPKSRIFRHEKSPTGVDLGATIYHGKDARPDDFVKRGVFVPPKYANSKTPIRTLKPSPEQLRTAMANKADNSPLLQTGQGTNTKTVRPSDIQNKARAKRITRMKKFGK